MPLTNRFSFNGGVGYGYVFASYDLDELYFRAADQGAMKLKYTTQNGFGSQVFGGFEYQLNRNVSFGLSASYLFFQTTVTEFREWQTKYYNSMTNDQSLNLDGINVLASLKWTWR
jgi:outer membrane protein W